jgi:hypothetical protein
MLREDRDVALVLQEARAMAQAEKERLRQEELRFKAAQEQVRHLGARTEMRVHSRGSRQIERRMYALGSRQIKYLMQRCKHMYGS